ncbi:MAG: ShlB/FhaC/HecB family hemolysin secretion/activation protein [Spongiibacteraceae bacterium]
MAIDLPPVLPPQLSTAAHIESYRGAAAPYVGVVNGYELRVTGSHHLTEQELSLIFTAAKTPSQAIILMNTLTNKKGYLLVSMQYAPDNQIVHVHAIQARVAGVKGETRVLEYFSDLKGEKDLSRAEFDKARVMANVHSQRVGLDYAVSYDVDPANPEDVSMVFNATPRDDHSNTDLALKLGNQGSRYVGRYFGEAALSHNFANAVRASVGYQTAFTDLGESRGGDDYHRVNFSVDRPFEFGLYGITGSHTQYTQELQSLTTSGGNEGLLCDVLGLLGLCTPQSVAIQTLDVDAEIDSVGLSGEQVLSSDINYRFNMFERLEYVDSLIEGKSVGVLQDEAYGTAEVGVKYFSANLVANKTLSFSSQISVKGGITGDSGTLGRYDEFQASYFASNPGATAAPQVVSSARTAKFIAIKPKLGLKLPLSASNSLNADFVAQFSDEQVPQQQQWVLGGVGSMSAYLPGILAGDSGYFTKFTFAHKTEVAGIKLTASAFAEHGTAWFENADGAAGDERNITDAGVRLQATLLAEIELEAVVARNIADDGIAQSVLDAAEADFYITLKKVF